MYNIYIYIYIILLLYYYYYYRYHHSIHVVSISLLLAPRAGPIAVYTTVFLIYPLGQSSWFFAPFFDTITRMQCMLRVNRSLIRRQ